MSRVREGYDGAGGGMGIDTDKAHNWSIERLWLEHDDPRVTLQNFKDVRTRGTGVGVKMNGDGAALAQAMDEKLTSLGYGYNTLPSSCGAMFDSETHHWDAIQEMYDEWRRRRKTRYTIITFEPWQEGDIPLSFMQRVNADQNVLLAVQGYMDYPYKSTGEKDQLYPADLLAAVLRLWRKGFLMERLTSFIGVKMYYLSGAEPVIEIPYGWEGILWKFNDLPSRPAAAL